MPKFHSLLNTIAAILTILGFLSVTGIFLYLLLAKAFYWVPIFVLSSPALFALYMLYKNTTLKGPVDVFADRTGLWLYNFFIYKRVYIWDFIYTCLCFAIPNAEWKHMNWGYAALNEDGHSIELRPEDENERFSTQYAHFVGTKLGTLKTLEGKTLLEVSSGRGGALSYYTRYLNPKKCIGTDLSEAQVDFCKKAYAKNPKLSFHRANAQELSEVKAFREEHIDIVTNMDSGHCYPNFKKFVQEVHKILSPGGLFFYSDFRPTEDWEQTEKDLQSCFVIKEKANITQNQIQSLKLDEARKLKLMTGSMGPFLRFYFKKIGGVRGSLGWEGLNSGRTSTMSYVLQKI
jgi:SAM-dependent methyltransferase